MVLLMNIRAAALGVMWSLGLLPAPAAAFTEIEVRQDHDGAGPSHIFHLHDSVVAVVDPLDGTVSAYADTHGAPVRTAITPVGFHPWRLVRLPSSVAIISEDGRSRIEVARDQTAWPREFALSENHASDAAYRVAPLVRTSAGVSLHPFRGAGALPIRAIGPYYVASARELRRAEEAFLRCHACGTDRAWHRNIKRRRGRDPPVAATRLLVEVEALRHNDVELVLRRVIAT